MKNFILIILAIFIFSCSGTSQQTVSTQKAKGLSYEQAKLRSERISDVHYNLSFSLDKTKKDFSGVVQIQFQLAKIDKDIRIDFNRGNVQSIKANEKDISLKSYNGNYINLPKTVLKMGENKVAIVFTHPYSKNSSALYRFKDTEDGRVYVYTDLEPFNANQVFPCFDQPDLKATYTVKVEAPENWYVITSMLEDKVTLPKNGRKIWVFPKSKKFSTYLFPLIAGPYHVFKDKAGDIPLRLFVRKPLVKHFDAQNWFKITKQGMTFFQKYFGYKYPFQKYDQILVPDFNWRGMENVGAVTYNDDRFVFRGKPTDRQRESRAGTILHELAHMWFGNLVTMKWWDDLWLNESFASYMATLSLREATEFKDSLLRFFTHGENEAYMEDQWVTTHPIALSVKNTDQAFSNFDAITYDKGEAVLMQLSYILGKEKFRKGVRQYFKAHAFGNTELKDFMDALSSASNYNLDNWTKSWLKEAGLNTIEVQYSCHKDKIIWMHLVQTADKDHPYLRDHRTNLAIFDLNQNQLQLRESVPVSYKGKVTKIANMMGQDCPDVVFPNYQDQDYVKVKLDKKSLTLVKKHLTQIQDPLLRAMLWHGFWENLRDGDMTAKEYLEIVVRHLPYENNFNNAQMVAYTVYGEEPNNVSLMLYLNGIKDNKITDDRKYEQKLESLFWTLFDRSNPDSDFKKLWFDSYVTVAKSRVAQEKLLAVTKDSTIDGLDVDQDRRWKVIWQLNLLNSQDAVSLVHKELKRDPSHLGKKMALSSQVIRPNKDNKQEWFDKIVKTDSDMSMAQLRTAMESLYPYSQIDLRPQYSQAFYKNLIKLSDKKNDEFLKRFTMNLVPTSCTAESVAQLDKFLAENPKLPPIVLRNLKVAKQEDERCVRILGKK